ncbi:hypothetical protein IIO_01133 [Bacillus cereus VD115]|nr:hypothetical protein IIO_01133 [Bacillus cereus VD115]
MKEFACPTRKNTKDKHKRGGNLKSHLKEILDNRGMKYSFVAKKANIASSTMSALVKGGLPTLPVAYRIAKVLDMRLEDIWIEDDYEDK